MSRLSSAVRRTAAGSQSSGPPGDGSGETAVLVDHLFKRYRSEGRRWRGRFGLFRLLSQPGAGEPGEMDDDDDVGEDDDVEPVDGEDGKPLASQGAWALKDVSFRVDRGQALAVLGPGGAGKTTLLRVLARLTPPTAGRAVVHGHTLLLTSVMGAVRADQPAGGNVRHVGRLFGVPREVVERRLPQVLEFAGLSALEKLDRDRGARDGFRRLGMSICLNLEPDVLLVDGFPSLADETFRERCLQRVERLLREADAAVVLASSDPGVVSRLCGEAVWLERGAIVDSGAARAVLGRRLEAWQPEVELGDPGASEAASGVSETVEQPAVPPDEVLPTRRRKPLRRPRGFNEHAAILSVEPLTPEGTPLARLVSGADLLVVIRVDLAVPGTELRCGIGFTAGDAAGVRFAQRESLGFAEEGTHSVVARVPAGALSGGTTYVARVDVRMAYGGASGLIARDRVFTLDATGASTLGGLGSGEREEETVELWDGTRWILRDAAWMRGPDDAIDR